MRETAFYSVEVSRIARSAVLWPSSHGHRQPDRLLQLKLIAKQRLRLYSDEVMTGRRMRSRLCVPSVHMATASKYRLHCVQLHRQLPPLVHSIYISKLLNEMSTT